MNETVFRDFISGGRKAAPIVVAYLMLGAAAGALGASRGLSPAEIALLSLLLFAGSAQFVFPELYQGAPQTLASAVFFINLRHLLYSTALAQQARRLSRCARAAIGAQLTDETFLVSTAHLRGRMIPSGAWMIGLNFCSYIAWCGGNIAGALLGGALDLSVVGVEFAGSAMFIALLFPQITGHARPAAAAFVAILGGGGAVAAQTFFAGPAAVVLVAAAAATLGALAFGVNESDRRFAAKLRAEEGE
ncbi:MAG: AzlC family ABC transporter permease [Gammaproteobacteria bacterium]